MNFTDEELLKFSDGVLDRSRSEQIEQVAKNDVALAETIAALEASRLPYRAAYGAVAMPTMPQELRAQVSDWARLSQNGTEGNKVAGFSRLTRLAAVASLVLTFGLGFIAAKNLSRQPVSTDVATQNIENEYSSGADRDWVQRVADYQSLYVAETVSRVTDGHVIASQTLSDITSKTGLATDIPDLSASGYEFVRAQELGYRGETLVQLVYLKDGKAPLALCHMPSSSAASNAPVFDSFHGLGTAFWTVSEQQFVIVAEEPESELRVLYANAHMAWL